MKKVTITSKDITAKQWSNLLLELNLIPLNYVNTDPFSSATMKVTTVKNNRKRVNGYEYIKA